MLDVRLRAFVLAVWLATTGIAAFGAPRAFTTHGTLFGVGDPDECHFSIDPDGETEPLEVIALSEGAACSWLMGTNARRVTITITPE